MVDLVSFFFNRFTNLLLGYFTGLLITVIISGMYYVIHKNEEQINGKSKNTILILILVIGTNAIGLLYFLLQFIAEFFLISYVDIAQLILFIGFIAVFLLLIAKVGTSLGGGDYHFPSRLVSIIAPLGFVGIFVGIFLLAMMDDFSIIITIVGILVMLSILITPIVLLLKSNTRHAIISLFTQTSNVGRIVNVLLIIFLFVGAYFVLWQANIEGPLHQARYFNSLITISNSSIFQNEVADDDLRLVDTELAQAIVSKHTPAGAGNLKTYSLHITTKAGRLVWVAAMGPDNPFNQEITYLLIIDANDPTVIPTAISMNGTAKVSEGLFYGADTHRVAWLSNQWVNYGRAYITWVPSNFSHPQMQPGMMVQIQTFNCPQMFEYYSTFGGVLVYDLTGKLLETYTDRFSIPSWISQSFDEDWLESNIANWGNLRQQNDFSILAPGFLGLITPSANRIEIDRDTRYIISPDTGETVGVTPVHPAANPLSNVGFFVSQAQGITYHDTRGESYISAEAAEQYVESQEPPAAQGSYYATLPLLYPISVANTTRMAWFTPLYHESADSYTSYNVQLRGLYILDAKRTEIHGRAYLTSDAATLIADAKTDYRQSYSTYYGTSNNTTTPYQVANVTNIATYVDSGTTSIVMKTNLTSYEFLLASPKYLSTTDWIFALMDVHIGSIVKFKAYELNDIWILTNLEQA